MTLPTFLIYSIISVATTIWQNINIFFFKKNLSGTTCTKQMFHNRHAKIGQDWRNRWLLSISHHSPTLSRTHHARTRSRNFIFYFIYECVCTPVCSRGQQCLYSRTRRSNNIPDVSGQQPGQVYDYDAQCRQVYGQSSRLCRVLTKLASSCE